MSAMIAVLPDASEALLRVLEADGDPMHAPPTVAPAPDVADEVPDEAVEVLAAFVERNFQKREPFTPRRCGG